jgi:hypothetical protein
MIPPSYLFRDLYQRRFEKDPAELLAEVEARKGQPVRGPFDGMITALIGAMLGSPNYILGAGSPECPDRRR